MIKEINVIHNRIEYIADVEDSATVEELTSYFKRELSLEGDYVLLCRKGNLFDKTLTLEIRKEK